MVIGYEVLKRNVYDLHLQNESIWPLRRDQYTQCLQLIAPNWLNLTFCEHHRRMLVVKTIAKIWCPNANPNKLITVLSIQSNFVVKSVMRTACIPMTANSHVNSSKCSFNVKEKQPTIRTMKNISTVARRRTKINKQIIIVEIHHSHLLSIGNPKELIDTQPNLHMNIRLNCIVP